MNVMMMPAFVGDSLQDPDVDYPAVENFMVFFDAHESLFLNDWDYTDCNVRAAS